ncbi:uncharacterized protein LOC141613977 [Silene latifolia]|uniref:uncharacterized protein LOC141613977 n=1 Tax=Silene latifolia TaxID=37657 RepID=UPI003D780DFB
MQIGTANVRRILVDGGSLVNLIMLDVLKAMKIKEDQITKKSSVLVGFSGETKSTLGEIYLPTYVEGVAFYEIIGVLDCLCSYNVILGRPWIHNIKAVPSTCHQCIKIPTDWGVATIKGKHKSAQEWYTDALKSSKAELVSFLKNKSSCIAWSHFDMTGISADVITHQLNIDTSYKPVQQKRRKLTPERNTIINEEVDKLLDMGMIKEDPFPLPHIDAMVNATAGHKMLTFMDASSGFNQIKMYPAYQESTAFINDRGIYCYIVMPFGKFLGYMVTKRDIEARPEQVKAILELQSPKTVKDIQKLRGRVAALKRFISRSSEREFIQQRILYLEYAKKLCDKFVSFDIEQIPRDLNTLADASASLGSNFTPAIFDKIPIVHRLEPAINKPEQVSPVNEDNDSWTKPYYDWFL